MTYVYTKPAFRPNLEPKTVNKTFKASFAVLAGLTLLSVLFIAVTPTSKPTPLATQPMVIQMPATQMTASNGFKVPEAFTYRGIDNAIRDVQMDNARLGHKMKLALKSDRNPIKRFFTTADRKYSLMGVLVGLAFLFTLVSFGFIRTSRDDLSNY